MITSVMFLSKTHNFHLIMRKHPKSPKSKGDTVHWEDPEESGGEGGERGDRDGEYM